jgi:hypothetical protein
MRRNKLVITIGIATATISGLFLFYGRSPSLVIAMGAISAFLIFALWDQPPKHKQFSDSDRLKATSLAMGGSGPPELPIPDMTRSRRKKRRKKK